MNFPYSFEEVFVNANATVLSLPATGTTASLTAGALGLFTQNWAVIDTTATPAVPPPFYIIQGSYHTVDKIGPHGGYKESEKSKLIDPRNITRLFTVAAVEPVAQVVAVGWDFTGTTGPVFYCGTTYYLRLDIKGSPALRFLNHNIYKDVWYNTGCCGNDCSSGCTNDPVDATSVMLGWKDFINQDPYISQFIRVKAFWRSGGVKTEAFSAYDKSLNDALTVYVPNTVAPAGIVAGLEITAAYADTQFGNCTFTSTDFYELAPLMVYASLRDESGEPCAIRSTMNSSTGVFVTEKVAPVQASGVGETVIRRYNTYQYYKQEGLPDGGITQLRLREVLDDTTLRAVSRTTKYDMVCIQYHVNQFSNPNSTVNNYQYLAVIYVQKGATTTQLTNWISAQLLALKSPVVLEVM